MQRFMGMMPSEEVKVRKYYQGENGYKYQIDAGPEGYTIFLPDGGTLFNDSSLTTELNLDAAIKRLNRFTRITEITDNCSSKNECGEC